MGRQRAARLLSRREEQQTRRLENKRKRKSQGEPFGNLVNQNDGTVIPISAISDLTITVNEAGVVSIGGRVNNRSNFDESLFSRMQQLAQERIISSLMVPASVLNGQQNDPRLPHYCNSCKKLETPGGHPLTMRYLEALQLAEVKKFVEQVSGLGLNYTDTLLLDKARQYLGNFFEEYRRSPEAEAGAGWFIDSGAGPQPLPGRARYLSQIDPAIIQPSSYTVYDPSRLRQTKPPADDTAQMRAKVARAQKLLIDSSNLLSRVIAGLEVTPQEAQALKARVDAGVEAFKE